MAAVVSALHVSAGGGRAALVDAVEIQFQATPFRAQRFLELYAPAVSRVLAYGAKGYSFLRSEEDPDHFIHISYWDDRAHFDRYWFSEEMQEVRRRTDGLYGQPVLPHWQLVVAHS